jgi:hypothetical protein
MLQPISSNPPASHPPALLSIMAGPVKAPADSAGAPSRLPATTPLHPPAVLLIILAHLPNAPLHSPAVLLIMAEKPTKSEQTFLPEATQT